MCPLPEMLNESLARSLPEAKTALFGTTLHCRHGTAVKNMGCAHLVCEGRRQAPLLVDLCKFFELVQAGSRALGLLSPLLLHVGFLRIPAEQQGRALYDGLDTSISSISTAFKSKNPTTSNSLQASMARP